MNKLSNFVKIEREIYKAEDNNLFAFSLGQAIRYYEFLIIILDRHTEVSKKLISNLNQTKESFALHSDGIVTEEQAQLLEESSNLTRHAHLEVESFYVFAKIFLDKLAFFLRDYFGVENKIALISHSNFIKNYKKFKQIKDLNYPDGIYDTMILLEKAVSDFRDDEIVHKTNPRTLKGTSYSGENINLIRIRIYPNEKDNQVESLPLLDLKDVLDKYIEQIILLIENNRDKSKFHLNK